MNKNLQIKKINNEYAKQKLKNKNKNKKTKTKKNKKKKQNKKNYTEKTTESTSMYGQQHIINN